MKEKVFKVHHIKNKIIIINTVIYYYYFNYYNRNSFGIYEGTKATF